MPYAPLHHITTDPQYPIAIIGCLICSVVLASPAAATDVPGPDSSSWIIAAPWWCYKTTHICQKLDVDGMVLDTRTPCTIEVSGYYNNGNTANMCVNED
jgi:hypothetical protein